MSATATQPELRIHPVYKAINQPLTIWGIERGLFFLAAMTGGATFNFFGSLLGGLLMFVGLFGVVRWATKNDPQLLRILLNSAAAKTRYDAAKWSESDRSSR
jgi:type IV secretory pathway TrbD component